MPSNTVQDRSILAGLSRVRKALQAALQWFSGDPTATATGARGSALDIWFRTNLTATQTGDTLIVDATGGSTTYSAGCGFDNGSLPITGTLTRSVEIPYGGTITDWTIVGDQTGSVSIVVSHATYAAYDTMTTLFTATCTSAKKAQGTGLSHTVSAGDILRFSASSFSNFTNCTITLKIT